jgi:hypothetical protein
LGQVIDLESDSSRQILHVAILEPLDPANFMKGHLS